MSEKTRGYIYIAFGQQYDYQCAHSARSIRSHSHLPITVVTNLKTRAKEWATVPNVNFVYMHAADNENRRFKTRPYIYSPYEETILLDTDVVALSDEIEGMFDYLELHDMAFPYVFTYTADKKVPLIYVKAVHMFGCTFPLVVHQGGVCVFKRQENVAQLFEHWYRAWHQFGRGREMQCLACMIQKTKNVHVGLMPGELYGLPHSTVLGHFYGKHRHKLLPRITKNKFFNKKDDWAKV